MGLELASRSNGWEEEVVCKKEGVQGNEILSLVSALRLGVKRNALCICVEGKGINRWDSYY